MDASDRGGGGAEGPEMLDPEAPPNLRLGLREKPEVREALARLGAKPGEDPLGYPLPDEPADDPEACAPDGLQMYIGPTEPPRAHHKTMELQRVKVRASALPVPEAERETVVSPRRRAPKRWPLWGAVAVGVGAVVVAAGVLRGAGGAGAAAGSAAAPRAAARATAPSAAGTCAVECAPVATAGSAAPSAAVTASATASGTAGSATAGSATTGTPHAGGAPRPRASAEARDPYADAATPVPKVTPSAEPVAPPPAAPPPKAQPEDQPVF